MAGATVTVHEICRVSARAYESSDEPLLDRLRVRCPVIGRERPGAECVRCPRFVGYGETWLLCRLPCSSCGSRRGVAIELEEVVFCEDCAERAGPAGAHEELGEGG